MFGLPLAFTVPFALVALAALPVLYILLRVTPPRPQRVPFPPLKLILDLKPKDETPANTPWWLLLLRLALAALIILAMAGPIWNPIGVGTKGKGPLLIVIDDSWAAAPAWDRRIVAATQRVEAARQQSQTVAIATSSGGGKAIVPVDAEAAIERLHALKPAPYCAGSITACRCRHAIRGRACRHGCCLGGRRPGTWRRAVLRGEARGAADQGGSHRRCETCAGADRSAQ